MMIIIVINNGCYFKNLYSDWSIHDIIAYDDKNNNDIVFIQHRYTNYILLLLLPT